MKFYANSTWLKFFEYLSNTPYLSIKSAEVEENYKTVKFRLKAKSFQQFTIERKSRKLQKGQKHYDEQILGYLFNLLFSKKSVQYLFSNSTPRAATFSLVHKHSQFGSDRFGFLQLRFHSFFLRRRFLAEKFFFAHATLQ